MLSNTNFNSKHLKQYELIIAGWKRSFNKHKQMDISEKNKCNYFSRGIKEFESSKYYKTIETNIKNLQKKILSQIRDFICINILLWNASRSGPIYNLTEKEFENGKTHLVDDLEMFNVQVRNHKTILE